MADPSQAPGNRQRLSLTDNLTIYQAEALKAQLLQALAAASELELDLSQVGDMDTAGLQLLIMLKREAQQQGKQLSLQGHSPAVRSVIDFCNLAAEFGDPLYLTAGETP